MTPYLCISCGACTLILRGAVANALPFVCPTCHERGCWPPGDALHRAAERAAKAAAAVEREECAKLVEVIEAFVTEDLPSQFAAAIRARGTT